MILLYIFLGSLILSLILFPLLRRLLSQAGHYQVNYQGHFALLSVGILFIIVAIFYQSAASLFFGDRLLAEKDWNLIGTNLFILVLGIGLLGLIDDSFGETGAGGFRRHLSALLKGHLTTGALKAIGGGLLALLVAARLQSNLQWVPLIINALIIALTVNTFNLLDLRPGRALKVFFLSFLLIFVFSLGHPYWLFSIIFLAAALVVFPSDLAGQTMLGDVGSNVLGAVIGLALVLLLGFTAKLVILFVLVALNLVTEQRSLSELIESVPLLRWLDELGRKRSGILKS
jgi:UDP-N-acetylmuramyl pentapeptide phosphotransferase/UDP-N-acetylglucosamine-1-phosphate transferase